MSFSKSFGSKLSGSRVTRRTFGTGAAATLAVATGTTIGTTLPATSTNASGVSKDAMIDGLCSEIHKLKTEYIYTNRVHASLANHGSDSPWFSQMQKSAEIRTLAYRLKSLQPATLAQETARATALQTARGFLAFV